jgi:hypothetical protein
MNRIPQISFRIARIKRLFLIAGILLTIILINTAIADSSGAITGIVTDSLTGLPIPGARVIIDSTSMGAMVNPVDGTYVILNVPLGKYMLRTDCIGYNKCTTTNVTVNADSITEINFKLNSAVIKCGDIDLYDGPPLITKDVSKITRLNKSHLNALPYQSIDKVIKYLCD